MNYIVTKTIDELEARLRRVKYILAGHSPSTDGELLSAETAGRDQVVSARLAALELGLHRLAKKSPVIQDVAKLCTDAQACQGGRTSPLTWMQMSKGQRCSKQK